MNTPAVRGFFERLDQAITTLARHKIAHLMVYGMSAFTMILGLVLVTGQSNFYGIPSFAGTFEVMPPITWGIVFAVTGVLLAVAFFFQKRSGRLPGLVLVLLYCVFSMTSWHSASQVSDGVFSPAVAYGAIAYFGVLVVMVCGVEE